MVIEQLRDRIQNSLGELLARDDDALRCIIKANSAGALSSYLLKL